MEEHLNSLAVTHLLQHTLRSFCIHENSQWVYAVFWRILPRNYPPPIWDSQAGIYDRSRGNSRNWILAWEDGFCNFAASTAINSGESTSSISMYGNSEHQRRQGLQPELFFKMSHEIHNYGEGLIGNVAADHSHKWIYKEQNDQEVNFLSAWRNSADSPRTWEAQFQSGLKTIALIAVREGVLQLGAVHKIIEDLSYVMLLRKKFSYIESIPGVLLPHPSSSSSHPFKNIDAYGAPPETWYLNFQNNPMKLAPSMNSLEALLSKLPSVTPPPLPSLSAHFEAHDQFLSTATQPVELVAAEKVAEEEFEEDENGATGGLPPPYHHHHHRFGYYHDLDVSSSMNNSGC